jgi:nitronate monooxygenase
VADDPRAVFLAHARVEVPLICGAMYPCSNPELVAAVSAAGGLGIVQPLSMIYVHGHDLREGLQAIRRITDKPVGFNAIVEQSSKVYEDRMRKWIAIALDEGVRFFVTALGNPRWVVDLVHARGGVVYHDVTERKWAQRAVDAGVDGLICVNARAGGHAGGRDPRALFDELAGFGLPLVCAGGVGDESTFVDMLELGYAAVQMGTRFIATDECRAHADYKQAIVRAEPEHIVLTERISGVPVAVIETAYVRAVGTKAGPIAKRLLAHPKAKHWMRTWYSLRSLWQLKQASLRGTDYRDYFQAGRSVAGIHDIEPAGKIVERFAATLAAHELRATELRKA